ncbi:MULTISPECIES: major capsid family protein [Lactobacillus]|uniref:DUF2184 domain-containing protein n=1 Tax=Lactobacillus xujianguonis TaxID=2495899 RepID=A0A437ST48_9LACO|nr:MULTISPECIES: major capsid family protein [Lactobacillus]RVU70017.1 DUF2184 domain-containing protein [Lactobacillus xujianguonis]RVU73452.1 DUF2184 domain-containing protein [Lactobacillus xujianguonis]
MPNTATITQRELVTIDKKIYVPKKLQLNGRNLFNPIDCGPYDEAYGYDVVETSGEAQRSGFRNTDTPVGDETKHRFFTGFTSFEFGVEFTDDEVNRARAVGDSKFIDRKTDQATRTMLEYENQVIFNGQPEDYIIGLTEKADKTGYAQSTPTTKLNDMTTEQLLNYFKKVSHKITDLHFNDQKPRLLITDAVEELLDVPYNEYNADKTVEEMISKYFSRIDAIPEMEAKYTGRNLDMGLVFLNDDETGGIPYAEKINRILNEHLHRRTTYKYREKFGGVVIRYLNHVVQLNDLIKPTPAAD